MDILLIAGLWLPESIWGEVSEELERRGHRPVPVALPGVDDGSAWATLDDQLDATVAAIDGTNRPMVVGHSAACTLAWLAADRRPHAIDQIMLIGGFPASAGETYADFFPVVDGVVPFPGWDPFEGADAADLDAGERERIGAMTVPVFEGVAKGTVKLGDQRRFDVPVLLVCPEYSPDEARGWIDGGDVPELSRVGQLSLVDINSGHWPMVTRPAELAQILDKAATAH